MRALTSVPYSLSLILFVSAPALSQLAPSPAYNPPPIESGTVVTDPPVNPNPQWSNLLGNLLWFYDAQKSGRLGDGNRVPWRNDSGLNDGQDWGVDLTGGFYDAGDYLKLLFPLSWTLNSLAWSGIDFGRGFDLSNQTAYLDEVLRWGFEWMIKCHPDPNTLFVQTGLNEVDNNYWGPDTSIPDPRPSFQINSTAPGTDAAASAAAALAAGSYLYSSNGTSLVNGEWSRNGVGGNGASGTMTDEGWSNTLRTHAEDLFNFAYNTHPWTFYSDTIPPAAEVYASSTLIDDLCFAAQWLFLATSNETYWDIANTLYTSTDLPDSNQPVSNLLQPGFPVLNWDSKPPAVVTLFAQISKSKLNSGNGGNDNNGDLTKWQAEAENYFEGIAGINGNSGDSGTEGSTLTDGGLLFYPTDSRSAALDPAMNAAQLLLRYQFLASDPDKAAKYVDFANGQVNYAMGDNPMKVVYVVGQSPNSPVNPHSAAAAGGNNIGNIDGDPAVEKNVLYGAVVGGPDERDRFFDIRSDYPETEPAVDAQVPLIAAASYFIINNNTDPFYVSLPPGSKVTPHGKPTDDAFPARHRHLSQGGKIAIAVVSIVVGLGFIGAVLYWKRYELRAWNRRRRIGKAG